MKLKNFNFVVFLLLIIFSVVSIGGCGGSSGGSLGGGSNNGGNKEEAIDFSVLDEDDYDSDRDGTLDILDFSDVEEQNYYGKDETIENKKISVPSLNYLERYKSANESADSFVVDLTAGTEYTVEISKGIAYNFPIGNSIPNVEIINPKGNKLKFLDFGEYNESHDEEVIIDLNPDVIELSMYPDEEPYMICYTFTPASTGSYKINLNQLVSGDDDNIKTLFVYKELRNEEGEAGYYKRYKFQDEDGSLSSTIKITDIIELRKAYNNSWGKLLNVVFETISEDEELSDEDLEKVAYDSFKSYFDLLLNIRRYYGIFDVELESDDLEIENSDEISASATSKKKKGKLNARGTSIPSTLYGIPYADEFEKGAGFFAVTGVKSGNDAMKNYTLSVPKDKKVKARYTATFVSSQEEREKLSKTTANASVAIGGFGVNASYSSNSSFKFGLTSTTLVIHYEELETSYRSIENSKYQLTDSAKKVLKKGSTAFRNEYGDYFVAGYKYGGTYDAFISITTDTTEQIEEVKKALSASYNSVGKAVSGDVANQTKDVLKKNNATVTIEIRTAGIDTSGKASKVTKETSIDAIGNVSEQLEDFRAKLKKSKPSDFHPVYVMLKRYRVLPTVLAQMNKDKDSGLIPIPPAQSAKIMNFNRDLLVMQSYYNVIEGLDGTKIDLEIKNALGKKYNAIVSQVKAYGNKFYMANNLKNMQAQQKKMVNLSSQLKALGDRYAFYRILMVYQANEISAYSTTDINYKPFGHNGGSVGATSFAVSKAVTSDIAAGKNEEGSYHETWKLFGHREWSPTFTAKTADGDTNAVYCHIQVVARNENDLNRDVTNSPAVGKNIARFYFQSGGTRYADWDIYLQTMRFKRDLYPFYGLK